MAIKHNNSVPSDIQEFYATNDIIQSSTQALAASGSAFAVAQGASTITGKAPGIKNAPLKTLYKVEVFNQDLARQGKGNYTFNVCTGNLSNFLGILRTMPDDPDRLEQRRQAVLKLQGVLDEKNQTVNLGEATGEAMYEARKLVTGKNEDAKQAYDKLNDSMRKLISQQYGINENALPDVGEGFGVLQGGKGGRAGYGHFAPVIARSGEDRVTLENDVSQESGREKTRVMGPINPHWYFRMFGPVKSHWYGKEDQTFWGESKKYEKEDYGDKPLVVRIGSQPIHQDEDNE